MAMFWIILVPFDSDTGFGGGRSAVGGLGGVGLGGGRHAVGGLGTVGSRFDSDDLALAGDPSHPWSLRVRAKQMLDLEIKSGRWKAGEGLINDTIQTLHNFQFDVLGNQSSEPFRGETWIAYARLLGRLAGVFQDQGLRKEARLLRLSSLRIGLEATDPSDQTALQYGDFVDEFVDLLEDQGELPLCQTLAHEMVILRRQSLGPKSLAFAAALEKLAQVLWARGDHIQATLLLEKAVAIHRAVQRDNHPDLNDIRYRLALLNRDRGEVEEARQVLVQALDQYESYVDSAVPFLPERERLALLARFSRSLAAYVDFSSTDAGQIDEAYRRLLAWKGMATAVTTAQRAALATAELRARYEELGEVRDELNRLYYAQIPADQAVAHALRLREQLERRSALESQLARSIGWYRRAITIGEVAGALPAGSALVDLYRYMRHVPATDKEIQARNQPPFVTHVQAPAMDGPSLRFEAHYVAFVVRAGYPVARVDLGRAEPIDEAVMAMVDQIETGRDFAGSSRELSQKVWEPMAAHLSGANWILIAPDGALSFLPWGALPGRAGGSYLLEERGFGLLAAARQLVGSPAARDRGQGSGRSLLVVGGVDYDHAGPDEPPVPLVPQSGTALLASTSTRAGAFGGDRLKVTPLPGTRQESDEVSQLFRAIGPGRSGAGEVRISGSQATKPQVRAAMPEKAYLHLATHGYFATPQYASALAPGALKVAARSADGTDHSEVHGLYPGLLSGLVWAGANQPETDPVTGGVDVGGRMMTAEEVAGLDLNGCELAVLSACETGRGQVAGGEGVLGLQRAFHEGGARRVVASLWKVDDEATRALMARFYTFLWRDQLDPLQALHAAQLELLRGQIDQGPNRGLGVPEASQAIRSGRLTHPRLWAAWVISGRPGGVTPDTLIWRPSHPSPPSRFLSAGRVYIAIGAAILATVSAVAVTAWLWARRLDRTSIAGVGG